MDSGFHYDVFLSHSAKDKAMLRLLTGRLPRDELKVPFHFGYRNSDYGFAKPGMSVNAIGSNWAQLEAGTFRFRDPLNQEHRFIPLRHLRPSQQMRLGVIPAPQSNSKTEPL